MFQWDGNELPKEKEIVSIDEEIASIAEFQIKREIQSWLRETNNCGLSEYSTEILRKECTVVENDCVEVDNIILGRSLKSDVFYLGFKSSNQGDTRNNIVPFLPKSTGVKILFFTALHVLSPFIILAGIAATPAYISNIVKDKVVNRAKVKRYRKNKNIYANEIVNKMMEHVSVTTIIDKVFQHFLKEIYDQVDFFCEVTVPKRINTGAVSQENRKRYSTTNGHKKTMF